MPSRQSQRQTQTRKVRVRRAANSTPPASNPTKSDSVELSMSGAIHFSASSNFARILKSSSSTSYRSCLLQFDFPVKRSAVVTRVRSRRVKSADALTYRTQLHPQTSTWSNAEPYSGPAVSKFSNVKLHRQSQNPYDGAVQ